MPPSSARADNTGRCRSHPMAQLLMQPPSSEHHQLYRLRPGEGRLLLEQHQAREPRELLQAWERRQERHLCTVSFICLSSSHWSYLLER